MRMKRQWLNRLRGAHLTATQCRMVLDGRSSMSNSARRQSVMLGVSAEDVYRLRLAVAVAEVAVCRAAIQAIDSESRAMEPSVIGPNSPSARRCAVDGAGESVNQRS